VFGESNEVFSPLVGGTSAKDIPSGRVARLTDPTFPGRTTLMKVSQVSTLWDYINRAMPWNQPKSLTADEVYAVTAFLLNLGEVVPDDFVLSDQTMALAQSRLPNRNGMSAKHGMWPGAEFKGSKQPDVQGSSCMRNCPVEAQVASFLPDFARNAHGNLYLQNRYVGQQVGVDTSKPEGARTKRDVVAVPVSAQTPAVSAGQGMDALLQKNNCVACHAADRKLVGPSWKDVAQKHASKGDYLAGKIRNGGSGVWGAIPMPAQNITEGDAKQIAAWLAAGAAK
jgi:cytochrome c